MKRCACGETDLAHFHKCLSAPDGLQYDCKKCKAAKQRSARARRTAESFDIDVDVPDEVLTNEQILSEQEKKTLRRVLFIPDCHIPYEDKRAWRLMLQVAKAWKPNTIVVVGDYIDCYSVSSHDKRPDRARVLDIEIADANERLSELDALGASEKYFVMGNHEDRLERYLMTKAPELFNMVRMRDLLKLDERGWKFTPYKQSLRLGKLNITHDVGNAGATAHTKALATYQGNVLIGHTHRLAVAYEGNAQGDSHVCGMLGWLGDINAIDYLHRDAAMKAWQLGFGVGWMEDSGVVHVSPVPVVNYHCVVEGRLFIG